MQRSDRQQGPDISQLSTKLQQWWDHEKNAHLGNPAISPYATTQAFWSCDECPDGHPHQWQQTVHSRAYSARCPFCTGRRICKHNSLATKAAAGATPCRPCNLTLLRNGIMKGTQAHFMTTHLSHMLRLGGNQQNVAAGSKQYTVAQTLGWCVIDRKVPSVSAGRHFIFLLWTCSKFCPDAMCLQPRCYYRQRRCCFVSFGDCSLLLSDMTHKMSI